jgi:hypothetical protein
LKAGLLLPLEMLGSLHGLALGCLGLHGFDGTIPQLLASGTKIGVFGKPVHVLEVND